MPYRVLPAVLCALLVCGCMVQRERVNIESFYDKADRVQIHRTTADELVREIGAPPASVLELGGGKRAYIYSFGDGKSLSVGVPLILLLSKTNRAMDAALFVIGPDGVVEETYVSNNSRDLPWEWWPFD